jgi:hypothetical protein
VIVGVGERSWTIGLESTTLAHSPAFHPYRAVRLTAHSWRLVRAGISLMARAPALLCVQAAALLTSAAVAYGAWIGSISMLSLREPTYLRAMSTSAIAATALCSISLIWLFARAVLVTTALAPLLAKGTSSALAPWRSGTYAGMAVAAHHLGPLARSALYEATFGLLLRMLEVPGVLGIPARLATRRYGMSYSAATSALVPVLLVEGRSRRAATRRSADLVRAAFGPGLRFSVGLMPVFILASLFVFTACLLLLEATNGFAASGLLLAGFVAASLLLRQAVAAVVSASIYLESMQTGGDNESASAVLGLESQDLARCFVTRSLLPGSGPLPMPPGGWVRSGA